MRSDAASSFIEGGGSVALGKLSRDAEVVERPSPGELGSAVTSSYQERIREEQPERKPARALDYGEQGTSSHVLLRACRRTDVPSPRDSWR